MSGERCVRGVRARCVVPALGLVALLGLALEASTCKLHGTARTALAALCVATAAPASGPPAPALPADATAWAATGKVVALERDGRIEVRDVSGRLLLSVPGAAPELSAGGRFLVAGGAVHDLASGRAFPLPGEVVGAIRWSPARDAIAFALKVGGATEVYLMPLGAAVDEPHLHRLTRGGGGSPRWVGHGRLAYEAARKDGGFGLFLRDAEGLGPEKPFWDEPAGGDPLPRPAAQA